MRPIQTQGPVKGHQENNPHEPRMTQIQIRKSYFMSWCDAPKPLNSVPESDPRRPRSRAIKCPAELRSVKNSFRYFCESSGHVWFPNTLFDVYYFDISPVDIINANPCLISSQTMTTATILGFHLLALCDDATMTVTKSPFLPRLPSASKTLHPVHYKDIMSWEGNKGLVFYCPLLPMQWTNWKERDRKKNSGLC